MKHIFTFFIGLFILFYSTIAGAHPVQQGYITRNGEHLFYTKRGEGKPVILFVHGLPLDSDSWHCQIDYFDKKYTVLTVDLRGYGKSSPLKNMSQPNLSESYADDIHYMLKQLHIDKVVYVGFATGGHVGMIFAAKYPETVSKLVLLNTSPKFSIGKNWPYGFDAQKIKAFNDLFKDNPMSDIVKNMFNTSMQENCQTRLGEIKQTFRNMTKLAGKTTLLSFFNNIAYEDFRPLLKKITAPTLILVGTLDQEVPPAVGVYMREQIPNAQLVELNGKDHFAFATGTSLLNKVLDNFIQPTCELCSYPLPHPTT